MNTSPKPSLVSDLLEALREIEVQLYVAEIQIVPTDDHIIADRLREALRIARAAIYKAAP